MRRTSLPLLLPLVLLGGCSRMVALSPEGPAARNIASLFWIFLAVAVVIWTLTMLAVAIALLRRRSEIAPEPPLLADGPREDRARSIIHVLIALSVVTIAVLTLLAFLIGRSLASLAGNQQPPLQIELTGAQWWWKVNYTQVAPSLDVVTANDIHVPVGRPIHLVLKSKDVIHSFWIPQIDGKRDLIPGQDNSIDFMVSAPGTYTGLCAEFCGFQHAHMRLVLIAEMPDQFDAWYKQQLSEGAPPKGEEAAKGQQVFLTKGCVMCHRIAGTQAQAQFGPDLTHLASRSGIAANTLPMTRGALAAWISNPQAVKPGANMPRVDLSADELNQIVAYLEQLK